MNITKDDLRINKRNNIVDVCYQDEVIYTTDKPETIDYNLIISAINKVEEGEPDINKKIKKFLIIIEETKSIQSDKQNFLLDRLIVEDKECIEEMRKLDESALNDFLILAAKTDIKYQQYNPSRLLKKWSIFLFFSLCLALFGAGFLWITILFLLFIITEPRPFTQVLVFIGKLKQNR